MQGPTPLSALKLQEFDSGRKQPTSPGCQSTTSTALGGSSGSTFRVTAGLFSSQEATSIYRNVMDEIDQDMATIVVVSSSRGWIRGQLQWGRSDPEDVSFTLLEIKRGYSVVGDVCEGPELFKKVCWKLKTVNGSSNVAPDKIVRGDRLILDGPSWAMERLKRHAGNEGATSTPTKSSPSTQALVPCTPSSDSTSLQVQDDVTTGATLADSPIELSAPAASSGGSPRADEFDIVRAGRSSQPPPAVPKLNLNGMQSRYLRPDRRPNLSLVGLCGGNCQLPEEPRSSQMNFGCL